MKKKILILDTSILCVWLKVPGKETCGRNEDRWDYDRVEKKIQKEQNSSSVFVLPLASIIETGNHIAQCGGDRHKVVNNFVTIISKTLNEQEPWAAFTHQGTLWEKDKLKNLLERWQGTVPTGQSLGDASIVDVATYYSELGAEVEILTGDYGLKAYEPLKVISQPRRRK